MLKTLGIRDEIKFLTVSERVPESMRLFMKKARKAFLKYDFIPEVGTPRIHIVRKGVVIFNCEWTKNTQHWLNVQFEILKNKVDLQNLKTELKSLKPNYFYF